MIKLSQIFIANKINIDTRELFIFVDSMLWIVCVVCAHRQNVIEFLTAENSDITLLPIL